MNGAINPQQRELALVLMRFNHVASVIVNADHDVM